MTVTRQINNGPGSKSYTLRLACFCFFFLIFLFFILRPSGSPSGSHYFPTTQSLTSTNCNNNNNNNNNNNTNMPASLSETLIHYATTNITPQQTSKEISVTDRVLRRKTPCNFLVFGLGHDSLMWAALNAGGRTVFLEEDSSWIEQIQTQFPSLYSLHVTYDTKVRHADDLLRNSHGSASCNAIVDPRESECPLALKNLPKEVYETEWDVIMVDAPTGYHDEAPGRMSAIYTAGLLARNRGGVGVETDVMVHDVDRPVEDTFSKAFLCEGYLKEQEGRLRHFVVPSHRSRSGALFCPA